MLSQTRVRYSCQGWTFLATQLSGSNTTVQSFQYRIFVSSKYRVKAKVRIFLIPKETPLHSAPLAIEMDKFLVTLKRGNNMLRRDSEQTPVTGKRQRSLLELQEALSSGNITERELGQFEGQPTFSYPGAQTMPLHLLCL